MAKKKIFFKKKIGVIFSRLIYFFKTQKAMALSRQLISIKFLDDTKQASFYVPEETIQYLSEVKHGLNLVCAVGGYRTGKSALLNQLCGDPNTFPTSNGSQACTRGIHMATKSITSNHLVFMDTEGLGALQSTIDIDSRILACAMLFSAKVYFFATGKIDTKVFESLQCAVGTAQWLRDSLSEKTNNIVQKPQFVLILKDVSLQLRDNDGNEISPSDYLEQSLNDYCDKTSSDLKHALDALFSERHCLKMCIPCKESDMKDMKDLFPEYKRDLGLVKQNAYHNTKPKLLDGSMPMTGPMLVNLAEALCSALNQPGAPKLMSVWDAAMYQIACEKRNQLISKCVRTLESSSCKTEAPEMLYIPLAQIQVLFEELLKSYGEQTPKVRSEIENLHQIFVALFTSVHNTQSARRVEFLQHIENWQLKAECRQQQQQQPLFPTEVRSLFAQLQETNNARSMEMKQIKDEFEALETENIALKTAQALGADFISTTTSTAAVSGSSDSFSSSCTTNSEAAERIANLEQELNDRELDNTQLTSMFETYKQAIEAKLESLADTKTKLTMCEQSLHDQTCENATLKKDMRDLQDTQRERETEFVGFTRKRKIDETVIESLKSQVLCYKQQITTLQTDLTKARTDTNQLKQQWNESKRQLAQLDFARKMGLSKE